MVVCAGLYPLPDADYGDLYRFGVYRKRSDCFGWLRESDISRADNGGWCLSVKFAGHSEGKELKKLVACPRGRYSTVLVFSAGCLHCFHALSMSCVVSSCMCILKVSQSKCCFTRCESKGSTR